MHTTSRSAECGYLLPSLLAIVRRIAGFHAFVVHASNVPQNELILYERKYCIYTYT